jgi:hypothetical protein
MAEYDLVFTGTNQEGTTDHLYLTITTSGTETTAPDGFTGYLITGANISLTPGTTSTIDGVSISSNSFSLLSAADYAGNNNLFSPTGEHFDGNGLAFSANGDKIDLYNEGSASSPVYTLTDYNATTFDTNTSLTVTPVCFTSGTSIRTARGDVAVEDLEVGDMVLTASGLARPIVWIGCKRVERPSVEQQPVRVLAGAFGEGLPVRDLRLSHGHAVCVDAVGEVLVPVGELVNGKTILREDVAEVTYWHVELESHDVLLAEGLPAESYLDAGNRVFFGRAHGRLATIDPDRTLADSCRPFLAEGPILAAIRERLAARAEARDAVAPEVLKAVA